MILLIRENVGGKEKEEAGDRITADTFLWME
jgi:hypothetical protein